MIWVSVFVPDPNQRKVRKDCMKARIWCSSLLLCGLACTTTTPKLAIVSRFAGPVSGVQQIQVKVTPSQRVEEIGLVANGDPLDDVEPTLDAKTGIYTFKLNTSILPNGLSTVLVGASIPKPDDSGYYEVATRPLKLSISNDISFAPVYDSHGNLIQEGWSERFGPNNYPIRASAIRHDKSGKVLPVQYTIRIANDTGLLRTITGTASNGLISVNWNLRDESGHVTTNSQYDVNIDTTWGEGKSATKNPTQGKAKKSGVGNQ